MKKIHDITTATATATEITESIALEKIELRKWFKTHDLLASGNTNPKTSKRVNGQDFVNYIMMLAPDIESTKLYNWNNNVFGYGKFKTLCARSTSGCAKECLYSQGRGNFDSIKLARIRKARFYQLDRREFMLCLEKQIKKLLKKHDQKIVIRLNGTSDICWEHELIIPQGKHISYGRSLMDLFPQVQFMDYTKIERRVRLYERFGRQFPSNYHLTFSISERHDWAEICDLVQNKGESVAVVTDLPKNKDVKTSDACNDVFKNIVDGRKHDFRFMDGKKALVILSALGTAKNDKTGFVKRLKNNTICPSRAVTVKS